MVKSLLDDTVNYIESPDIDIDDLEHDANLYETEIYKKAIVFALGKPKYTYIDNNIVYYPIYWVEKDEITMQIGVYEILASDEENIYDSEGDIDLNKFPKPLLFAFAYTNIVAAPKAVPSASAAVPSVAGPSVAGPSVAGPSVAGPSVAGPSVAGPSVAGPSAAGPSVAGPKTKKADKWIQSFMHSDQYNIIDTKYDGNCFFSMVKLALEENDQDFSIDEMRDLLAEDATEEVFQNYKELYDNYQKNEATITREIKNIAKRHRDLTATLKKTKDRNLVLSFEKQSADIERMHTTLKKDRKEVREALEEYAFMKGIDNLSMLKLKIKTSDYWADTWAISTIERELNIKIIIFSELNYRENDEINVLRCGQLNDVILEERGIFEPSFYILAAYHGGYHYQMITYNHLKSFSFEELPAEIKDLVTEKCLEKIAGPYSLIPEFKDFALKQHALQVKHDEPIVISSDKEESAAPRVSPDQLVPAAPLEELSSDLYDNGTLLRFYSKSVDKPLPGKGVGEILGPEGAEAYIELARIPQWRKKLTNSWPAAFKLDNHKWLTVEHYYQAAKFKRKNKEFYLQFSLDSADSSIAKDADLAKAAGGKSGKFKGEVVRPKNVILDADFYQKMQGAKFSRGEIEMEAAMRAKFSQNADLKQLLLATKKAKLEHIRRGAPAEVYNDLMRVRRELKEML